MRSQLAVPESRSSWVLQKTQIPTAVAVELLRRNPDIIRPLSENPILDRSVFDDVSWKGHSVRRAVSLIWAVSESAAVRWVASSDRRKRTTAAFLHAWIMGSDLQREFLRTRGTVLPELSKQLAKAFTKNMFDQDLVYEYLSDGTWRFPTSRVALWLAHNPSVVDDATFVDWLTGKTVSLSETSGSDVTETIEAGFETTLALTVRPHLTGALLGKTGPSAAVVAAEVDAPAHINHILDMLETEWRNPASLQPVECVRTLYRLACHPGLSAGLRSEICDRVSFQEQEFRRKDPDYARHYQTGFLYADDAALALEAIPSGNPADYTLEELRSAVGFYRLLPDVLPDVHLEVADLFLKANRRRQNMDARRLMFTPVDVLEGLAAAAVRHREADPRLGDAVHELFFVSAQAQVKHSHRLLDLSDMLSENFPVETTFDNLACGTHRPGYELSPGSVARSSMGALRGGEAADDLAGTAGWQAIGTYQICDALQSRMGTTDSVLQNSIENVGRYLTERLGSDVGATDKWEAFLLLANELSDTVLLSEAVDLALALHP